MGDFAEYGTTQHFLVSFFVSSSFKIRRQQLVLKSQEDHSAYNTKGSEPKPLSGNINTAAVKKWLPRQPLSPLQFVWLTEAPHPALFHI